MPKPSPQLDVLVLGDHPCAYLAAALLRQGTPLRILHSTIPGESFPDRLVVLNPKLFELHPLFSGIKRKLELVPTYGLRFIGDSPTLAGEHAGKTISAYVGVYKQVRAAMVGMAKAAEVPASTSDHLEIHGLDERGVDVTVGKTRCHPKLILLAGTLPAEQRRLLGLPEIWDHDVVHRYTFLKLKGTKWLDPASHAVIPMSLDLKGSLAWAWLLPGPGCVQLAIEQPPALAEQIPPTVMLKHWMNVLVAHGQLKVSGAAPSVESAVTIDLPLAGALAQEGIANRTLLFGPAGGFYSACAEDIYPCCWSALFAADAARKALREHFVQDALATYRQKWGATLGDYLRGPQQNLRFLLPLVYRNRIMTSRLADAILSGKSVVR